MATALYPEDWVGDPDSDPPVLDSQVYWVRGSDGRLARDPVHNLVRNFVLATNAQKCAEEHQALMRLQGQADFEAWVVGPGFPERHEQNRQAAAAGKPLPFPAKPHQPAHVATGASAQAVSTGLAEQSAEIERLNRELQDMRSAEPADVRELKRQLAEANALLEAVTAPAAIEPVPDNDGDGVVVEPGAEGSA